MTTAAIYSRKSRFTGTGESIKNQVEMCKEYASKHFNVDEFIIYEDEGFSGGNTDRPKFKQMFQDAKNKKFDILICYRLDRISRNVLDFSKTVESLNKYDISFVSIREQFDTSTPMGRAMMYISSVFAQLERETIAERIKDNMQKLAIDGKWLGGNKPYAYTSKQIKTNDNRKEYMLIEISEEMKKVTLIYKKYLELQSFSKVESYFIRNNIKRKNTFFNKSTIAYILRNPVYCIADNLAYEYFNKLNATIPSPEKFNGKNGLIGYSKRDSKTWTAKDKEEWFVGIGKHKGRIKSKDWIHVQSIIKNNSHKAIKTGTSKNSIITPLLECSCGSKMKASHIAKNKDGSIKYFYYVCRLKERTHGSLCNKANLNGIKTDKKIVQGMKEIAFKNNTLEKQVEREIDFFDENKIKRKNKKNQIESDIADKRNQIEKLVDSISNSNNTAASKYILEKIDIIDSEIKSLENELFQINENNEIDILKKLDLEIQKELMNEVKDIDDYDFEEKQSLIHKLVDKVIWDGNTLNMYIKGTNFTNSIT